MLVLKLVKESLFLNVLEAMLDLVDVVNVDCSRMGLKLQAGDTDDITIIELFIPAEDFKNYYCDEVLSVGIPIDDMVKAIRCADEDDTITIKIGDENFDTITLSFESPKNNTTAYNLRVVDANDHIFHIPDQEVSDSNYQAIVQMPSAVFMRICKCLSNIGDGHISVTEKGLMFFAFGESEDVNIEYIKPEKATTTNFVTYNMQAPVSFTLDLKYLYSVAKLSALVDQVKIYLSTKHPLMVKCEGCKMGKMGYMRYYLAPKVRTEIEEEEMSDEENEGSAEEKEGSAEIKGSGEDKGSERGGEQGRKRRKIEEQK